MTLSAIVLAVELVVSPEGLSPRQALEKVREIRSSGDRGEVTVRVKRGFYSLAEPLRFTPGDGNLRFIGEEGAVFAGGDRLGGWRNDGGGVWSAPVPVAPDGAPVWLESLWVNGRRAGRARLPNGSGYFPAVRPRISEDASTKGLYREYVGVTNAEAAALRELAPGELGDAQMCVVHKWSFARRILRGFDPETMTVETHSPANWNGWQKWNEKSTLVAFENVRSAFDEPGEWFYDRRAGRVLYRPLPGEDMASAFVVAPNRGMSRLVEFCGDPDRGGYVDGITFENLSFEYTAATPANGRSFRFENSGARFRADDYRCGKTESWQHQAAFASDAAITLVGARQIVFDRCRVAHTGNYAVEMADGAFSNRVVGCVLEDLGAGGVRMGEKLGGKTSTREISRRIMRPTAPRACAFNLVSNSTIRAAGRFNPEGTGVAIMHASNNRVIHCDIHDIMYTGVSVGWVGGFKGSVAQRNEIAFNRIHDLGKGILSDMGGVYTLGTSFGTRVHDNVIHDVWSYSYGGWALYTDEGSEGIVMERNLCWNTTDGGFHQHYGTGCVIRNNIFAWNRRLGAVRMRRDVVQDIPCTLHFLNNIILVKEGPLCGLGVRNVGGVWANNLWWDLRGEAAAEFDGLGWSDWKKCGKETGSRFADPLFADAEAGDFTLGADSPAFALGFSAWDYSLAGRNR